MAGVSDTPGFQRYVYQAHLAFYPILAPQNGRRWQAYQIHLATCIRHAWLSIPRWQAMAGVSDTPGFQRYVYQAHLAFYPILAPQNGRRWQAYQIHLAFNGTCIRHAWLSIPRWQAMAGVSDTPGFQRYVYQAHLAFYPILAPQKAGVSDSFGFLSHDGTPKWHLYQVHVVSMPPWPPKAAPVSDTVCARVFLKMSCVNGCWCKPFQCKVAAGVRGFWCKRLLV